MVQVFKNYPIRYLASDLGVAYAFAFLLAIAGLVWWIISGLRSIEYGRVKTVLLRIEEEIDSLPL